VVKAAEAKVAVDSGFYLDQTFINSFKYPRSKRMTDLPMKTTFKENIVLEQMRRNYGETIATSESLDRKATTVISVSSIVITIVTGFSLAVSSSSANRPAEFGLIVFLYIATFFFSLRCLLPTKFATEPIQANWESIDEALKSSDVDFYGRLLSGYEKVIATNRNMNIAKAKAVRNAFTLLGVTVLAAFASAFF
jgi:hypothetical protein